MRQPWAAAMARRLSHPMALAAVSLLVPASASAFVQPASNSTDFSLGGHSNIFTARGEAIAVSFGGGRSTQASASGNPLLTPHLGPLLPSSPR